MLSRYTINICKLIWGKAKEGRNIILLHLLFPLNLPPSYLFFLPLFTLQFIYFFKLNKNLTNLEGEVSDTHCLILALNNPRALPLVSIGRS